MDKKSSQQKKAWRRPGSKPKKRKFQGKLPQDHEKDKSNTSASAQKLKKSKDTSFDVPVDQTAGYSIIHFFMVFTALQQYLKCKVCDKDVSFLKRRTTRSHSTTAFGQWLLNTSSAEKLLFK
ncbi:hypothetical protein ALC62_02270 [Cyphomyrmex costatus]|uniref:Uncharacterized protein n=1 Tax=Cyphomyrmex costatus TaxID=456900 RepID=A0A151IN49_9HYME|nr:hypothetical protein ALC62_02270 [Cyphomyrmex costatus]